MKISTRWIILSASAIFCVAGIVVAKLQSANIARGDFNSPPSDIAIDEYQLAASHAPKLTFQQLETLIRRDPVAKAQRGRLEFGSLKMEQGTALAEVMFVSDDGRVQPFLYKLLPERDTWKIVNVQRMWFVPRSRLLRGVRA
jgi:hypothetical protein